MVNVCCTAVQYNEYVGLNLLLSTRLCPTRYRLATARNATVFVYFNQFINMKPQFILFVCLFAWGLTALSPQIGYITP